MSDATPPTSAQPYRVLARKYRPATFAEMIGQEALVRTLSNAFSSGRIAHAFMLTGVRGVGKTTTARIIARALNCVGPDGKGGPTISPCGVCAPCQDIAEDRHVDVLEIDAASRAGIGEIRELIDGIRYRPVSARYKVYILDEVHMLSNPAFNALLKTLEEPPPDVKFVFATTEIRKVPVTVLSRCQRFDLKRISLTELSDYLGGIAAREGIEAEAGALRLVARGAEGSARDALSLLDRAIALGGSTNITEAGVAEMLGLADRSQLIDLFQAAMEGRVADALGIVGSMYRSGADPTQLVQDLLELTHAVSRIKLAPEAAADLGLSEVEATRGKELAEKLPVPSLTRAWQMLLKGLSEVQQAESSLPALEMVLIRLAHVADMPTPGELLRRLQAAPAPASGAPAPPSRPNGGGARAVAGGATVAVAAPAAPAPAQMPASFEAIVALFAERREALIQAQLETYAHVVKLEPGRLEMRLDPGAQPDLANRVGSLLSQWTGQRWIVSLSTSAGEMTLTEKREAAEQDRFERARALPIVQAVMSAFPGAEIVDVRDLDEATPEAAGEPPPEEGDLDS
ncbi:MAG: DNA polymerase III subunit gamma/tau [Alphaproteobacteria bacterium]|nr:DNA polymerase III subunit gamma/tau [Alphaproteobacteria bacterium]